jgi:hypothetical protein
MGKISKNNKNSLTDSKSIGASKFQCKSPMPKLNIPQPSSSRASSHMSFFLPKLCGNLGHLSQKTVLGSHLPKFNPNL